MSSKIMLANMYYVLETSDFTYYNTNIGDTRKMTFQLNNKLDFSFSVLIEKFENESDLVEALEKVMENSSFNLKSFVSDYDRLKYLIKKEEYG